MRISGGDFRGRTVEAPASRAVRPTQDRVREALFSILAPEVPGSSFLDLFAGSGAVAIEALSRGAASAALVERDRAVAAAASRNVSSILGAGASSRVRVVVADVYRWIASYSGDGFGIAFADPPYALGEERGYASFLATLAERGVVKTGGLFVAEMTAAQRAEETPGWDVLRDRRYGRTRICIWRRL